MPRITIFLTGQASYRQGHSTQTAVLCMYYDLERATLSPPFVLLDSSSASDTVVHSTLLTVFDWRLGVLESAMDWFAS